MLLSIYVLMMLMWQKKQLEVNILVINMNVMSMARIRICFKFTYLSDSVALDICCSLSILACCPKLRDEKDAMSLNGVLERNHEVFGKF